MQTVHEFLSELASAGVKLSAAAGQLSCYAQKGALTSELRDGIARFKPELLALLGERARPVQELPLSAGQKGLYILQKLHPAMTAYNVPLCFQINADIDAAVLAKAWDSVQEQFPILTARIVESNGALVQRLDGRKTSLQHVALHDSNETAFLVAQVKQPFDLNRGPLTRAALYTRRGRKSILLLTVHHIIFDGASAVMTLRTLLDFYLQLSQGATPNVTPSTGYADFVTWEETMLASSEGAAHARYWQQQLDGAPAVELPPDLPRPDGPALDGRTLVADLPEDLCNWVRTFSKSNAMPASVVFLGLFQLLLQRHTNEDDVVVGMPVMGRPSQRFATEVGYFINMVPLRARLGDAAQLVPFLRRTQATMLDALYHSTYPFPLMAASGRAVFRISYAYQNFVRPADFMSMLQQQTFQLETVSGIWQEGDFDFGLEIYEGEGSAFSVHIKYNPELYTAARIERFYDRYCALLRAASADPTRSVHEYDLRVVEQPGRSIRGRHGQEQLPGVIGDLYVDGVNTGNRARWTEDGAIDVVQRRPANAAEIEARLMEHPSIEDAAVLLYGERVIAVYRAASALSHDELRELAAGASAFIHVTTAIDHDELTPLVQARQSEYWQKQLAAAPRLELIPDFPHRGTFTPATYTFELDPQSVQKLAQSAARRNGTVSMALGAAFQVLLYRCTGQRDLCVRVDGLPLRNHVDAEDTYASFLAQVKATWVEADAHREAAPEGPAHDLAPAFDGTTATFTYDAALFRPETIERLAAQFVTLCRAIAAKPIAKIRTFDFLTDAERQQIMLWSAATPVAAVDPERQLPLAHSAFIEHARKTPAYASLLERSTAVAQHLQSLGVGPESIVAVCMDRSPEMVAAMLGTMMAGGAWLVLDPAGAEEQLAYILQDSAAPVVIAQDKLRYKLTPLLAPNAKFLPWSEVKPAKTALRHEVGPQNLAYVQYTTGGAGKPKGVMVEHTALVRRLQWLQRRFALTAGDVVLHDAPFGSNAFVWQTLWPLNAGATITFDATGHVTPWNVPRLYAPAEGAGEAAWYDGEEPSMIGKPIDDTQIYILDAQDRPQPIGVAGELHIAGESIPRGFLRRPKVTQEMFVANPFVPGTRMFKTGELARWRDDGTLQSLGRKQTPQ